MVDMKDKAKNAADTVEDKAKGIAGKAADMAQSAKQAGEGLLNRAGDIAGQARDKVEDWAGDARDAIQNAGEKAQRGERVSADERGHLVAEVAHGVRGRV